VLVCISRQSHFAVSEATNAPTDVAVEEWRPDRAVAASVERDVELLGEVLHAVVHAGAGVSFFVPFSIEEARAFWREKVLPGVMPSEKLLADMGKFNEELVKAGVMLAGEGLHASSKGKRVVFSGGKKTVVDGPFAETKEVVAGFWLWQVKSIEEAVEWVRRRPEPMPGEEAVLEKAYRS